MSHIFSLVKKLDLSRYMEEDIINEICKDGSVKKYIKGRLLGKGGFAKCFHCTDC